MKHKTQNILVVEDDINSQKTLGAILKQNYNLFYSASVAEAKEKLVAGDISLIILDLSLEGDEDGLDFMKYLRSKPQWQETPVIAVTAHAFAIDRKNALAAGCNDYMSKPIDIKLLKSMIQGLIRKD